MPIPSVPVNDSAQSGLYKSYSNDNAYTYVSGLVVIPLAADTPATQLLRDEYVGAITVRLHQPYSIRKQSFAAKKEQTPPVMPAPTSTDTLISSAFSFPLPEIGATATPTYNYSMAGQYVYLGNKPYSSNIGYPGGRWPFQFPELNQQQSALISIAGAVAGGAATVAIQNLNNLTPNFDYGTYYWPFSTFIANSFFDPALSNTTDKYSNLPDLELNPPVT
jgi:hypothetical protein